jgi:hypothetical protein
MYLAFPFSKDSMFPCSPLNLHHPPSPRKTLFHPVTFFIFNHDKTQHMATSLHFRRHHLGPML